MTTEEVKKETPKKKKESGKQVVIPLLQHIGITCKPLVKVKDEVLIGQKIGENSDGLCASVHSSIAGHVVAIEERLHPLCGKISSIVIESDETNRAIEYNPHNNPSKEDIINAVQEAGIVDLTGYPLYDMLTTYNRIDTVLINLTFPSDVNSNCAPENIPKIIEGMKLLMKGSGALDGAFIIHKYNQSLSSVIKSKLHDENIEIFTVKDNYSPTMANLLAYEITGIPVPNTQTPLDAGVILSSASGALAVTRAVNEGIPHIEANVTVSGAVRNPGTRRVNIGTSFKEVIQSSGGYSGEPGKIIMNGSLNGTAQPNDEVPVIKSTTEIIVQSTDEVLCESPGPCIHCARCVDVCPVNILPGRIASFSDMGMYDECFKMHVSSCIECGQCFYVCPSNRHLVQLIKFAKVELVKLLTIPDEEATPIPGCQTCENPCLLGEPFISGGIA
ncbi:MAG: RnfABCDGE type electron transport complex subunit C [Candidatus Methanomarinus sp.]|uniref:RnfABCDGE type electron transport complex subunit C n=1 Tax=Candidatus Methanomarinus sp. TaxID=3386244 RepID=A0AC61SBR7_9EURY|nr:MAG: RnfABCDGE type electron transport complex subunit C [ANME-2 cluster archaeon]